MGNSLSSSEASKEKEQERIRRQYGVLIPPSFIDSSSSLSSSALPISCQSRLRRMASPDVLEDLWTMNQGRQLLETYMKPGVTLNVPTATKGNILVDLNTTDSVPTSFLWAEQPLSETTRVGLLVPTADSPNFQFGYKHNFGAASVSSCSIKSQMNTRQEGWIEGRCKTTALQQQMELLLSVSSNFKDPGAVSVQAAAEYQQSLLAVKGVLDEQKLPRLESSMISLNLNHPQPSPTIDKIDDVDNAESIQEPPPLWLTLKQNRIPSNSTTDNKSWVLNLSQVLTFDRNVWNLLEERAPKVRQTLGWSLQMETTPSSESPQTKWSMGGTWQINRGIALKGVVCSSHASPLLLNYGVILKRWKQPRATLSILNQFDFEKKNHSFVGFGVELQASPFLLSSATSAAYPDAPPPDYQTKDHDAPTKVHLPKQ